MFRRNTECPISLVHFYIATYFIERTIFLEYTIAFLFKLQTGLDIILDFRHYLNKAEEILLIKIFKNSMHFFCILLRAKLEIFFFLSEQISQ